MIARDVLKALFPADHAPARPEYVDLGEPLWLPAARASERWISRVALASAIGLLAMMAIRIAAAWAAGRI